MKEARKEAKGGKELKPPKIDTIKITTISIIK